MLRSLRSLLRLAAIARVLARHDALAVLEETGVARPLVACVRLVSRRRVEGRPGEKLARALSELGPSFIKLGQFASTRADLLGEQFAADLSRLQDQLPAFAFEAVREAMEREFGRPLEELFDSFDEQPVSAASIAQVHFATVAEPREAAGSGESLGEEENSEALPAGRAVAVKVLRPGIEKAFARDLALFYWLAEMAERTQPWTRRLKPIALVRLFEEQVTAEMDLRMEAAAASELAQAFAGDETYRVPQVDWQRTGRRVMTQSRLSGIPLDDREALIAAGHDVTEVLERAAAIFFNQVFRDGFFHGDQHPGNMFVTEDGAIGAVDFGIMGRLDRRTRYFLADMLLALLDRDYLRLAQVHVEAGYLPPARDEQSLALFAQALRAVCEPIFGRPLSEISFARLLGQLFQLSESFQMEVQPQLLLLQKNMMMAEGVSRRLAPDLDTWTLAQPLIADWMRAHRGPQARIRDQAGELLDTIQRLPRLVAQSERLVERLEQNGLRLDTHGMGNAGGRLSRFAAWSGLAFGLLALILAAASLG